MIDLMDVFVRTEKGLWSDRFNHLGTGPMTDGFVPATLRRRYDG